MKWETAQLTLQRRGYPLWIGGTLLLAAAVPYQPGLLLAAVGSVIAAVVAVLSPFIMSYLMLFLSAISVQYLFEVEMMGLDLQSLYKFGLIALGLPAALQYGMYGKRTMPVFAVIILCLIALFLSDKHPMLAPMAPVITMIGMMAPFLYLAIRWPPEVKEIHLKIIALLPLVSVIGGTIFQAMGLTTLMWAEYTGAIRLQGANIPAHLAFLAFAAFAVSMIQLKRLPEQMLFYYTMMGINFLIMLMTGTRGPLVASALLVALFVFDMLKRFVKGKSMLIIPLLGFVLIIAVSVALQMDNMMKRSASQSGSDEVNLSGREQAWAFFMEGANESPWFGRGLGAVLVGNDGTLDDSFSVPHNEYIRFYYDSGIVGATILLLAWLIAFRDVRRGLPRDLRGYCLAFIIGFAIYSFTDNTISTIQIIVPFCFALNAFTSHSLR